MGHDISVKYKDKIIYEIRIPAFDLATSYAFYEALDALDYHNGVSGNGQEMRLHPSMLLKAVINLNRIAGNHTLEEWKKKLKTTPQQDVCDTYYKKTLEFVDSKMEDIKSKEVGEIGKTLEDKCSFLYTHIIKLTKELEKTNCGVHGVIIQFD